MSVKNCENNGQLTIATPRFALRESPGNEGDIFIGSQCIGATERLFKPDLDIFRVHPWVVSGRVRSTGTDWTIIAACYNIIR